MNSGNLAMKNKSLIQPTHSIPKPNQEPNECPDLSGRHRAEIQKSKQKTMLPMRRWKQKNSKFSIKTRKTWDIF
jgi:hypothetical protein